MPSSASITTRCTRHSRSQPTIANSCAVVGWRSRVAPASAGRASCSWGHPQAGLQSRFARIQRRRPFHHQIDIVNFTIEIPPCATGYMSAIARRNRTGMEKSRTLVPMASMRSPTSGSPDQTRYTGSAAPRTTDLGERPHPDFPACAGVPQRGPRNSKLGFGGTPTWTPSFHAHKFAQRWLNISTVHPYTVHIQSIRSTEDSRSTSAHHIHHPHAPSTTASLQAGVSDGWCDSSDRSGFAGPATARAVALPARTFRRKRTAGAVGLVHRLPSVSRFGTVNPRRGRAVVPRSSPVSRFVQAVAARRSLVSAFGFGSFFRFMPDFEFYQNGLRAPIGAWIGSESTYG